MDRLILEIELPDFNADGIQQGADDYADGDVLAVVVEEIMREEVGVTMVGLPGEKCLNSDFEIHASLARIVGARIKKEQA